MAFDMMLEALPLPPKADIELPADDVSPIGDQIKDAAFRRALDLLDRGNVDGLRAHLRAHPDVVHQRVVFERSGYFQSPSLLEFVAENPIRHGKLPANIVDVAREILEAGAKNSSAILNSTLGLVCSGRVARESGVQVALISLLCRYGADPNAGMGPALLHGEFEAAKALIQNNARIDMPVAAALGRVEDAHRFITAASAEDRHRALALSAQFGHTEIVRSLLDAGEDPSRYNPAGTHSHSTPLHQAALAGHYDVVTLLAEHGARLDLIDTIWHSTPEGWAKYGGQNKIAEYLRTRGDGSET